MLYGYITILCLFMILLGYGYGRRIGNREGYLRGEKNIPLSLKLDYYQTGQCPICTKQQMSNKGGKG